MTYFQKIIAFSKPYYKYVAFNVIFNILYALFSTLSLLSLIPMLDVLFQQKEGITTKPKFNGLGEIKNFCFDYVNFYLTSIRAEHGENRTLIFVCCIIVILFFFKNIANYFAMFFITFLRNGLLRDLRNAISIKILGLSLSSLSDKHKGDFISRITTDVQEIQWTFLAILELLVREPITILFTLISMMLISAKLTLFVFIFLPTSGLFISFIGKKLKKHSDRAQREQGRFLSLIEETLSGLKIIQGYNAVKKFESKLISSTSLLNRIMNSLINRQNLASPLSEILGITSVAIVLWFGGQMVLIEQSMEAATFIGYITLSYQILEPAKQISKASYNIKKGNAAAERIIEILETKSTIKDPEKYIKKNNFNKDISIENINFSYEDKDVIEDFSLKIPKGKTVALVGQSGSGKSTIASLLARFYDVDKGSIKIDGIDIRDMRLTDLRDLLAIVSQKSILFNDTIKNNLTLGVKNASEKEIINASKIANAHEFIIKKTNGYEHTIGDAGDKLSGGQQQRLSIARAVLKNSPIMILDEATSALDTESEKLVQKALDNIMGNRTSIIIAHRLSTIQKADLIVVMKKGRIVEQGTHNNLIAQNGEYNKLVRMQSFT